MNNKSKMEQLFILLVMCSAAFALFCLTGCGGEASCETIQCSNKEENGIKGTGISIPGCGGCLGCDKGCNSCLWLQSCKYSVGSLDSEAEDSVGYDGTVMGCDHIYYGGGCLGCGAEEKSCYSGCIDVKDSEDEKMTGCFWGATDIDDSEKLTGSYNGCGACTNSGGTGFLFLRLLEEVEKIH